MVSASPPPCASILVVEDEPDLRDAMVSFLQLEGFAAAGVGSTAAADAWMAGHEVDIIILDLGLPDRDGIAWITELDGVKEKGVVMATARGKLDDRITGLNAGADAYLVKPVELGEMVAVVRNMAGKIADRRRAEQAGRAKDEFLATISHELRTPLTAMLGTAELLTNAALTPSHRQMLERLRSSGELLLGIANDMLDLSRIEAGQLPLEPQPIAVGERVREAVGLLAATASAKGIGLVCNIPPLPPLLWCDPQRLQQVVLNLVINAIKFTHQGGITVDVDILEADGDTVRLCVCVSDTGIGIAPEALPRLFEPFSQLGASPQGRAEGSGLGLAIARRLVEAMGGGIDVESTPGEGSTFWFTLPLRTAHAASPGARTVGLRPRPLSMLLVEDVVESAMVIEALLRHEGHTVTVVESGLGALAALERASFDLVLMDLHMPGLDGFETTRRLRQLPDPGKAQTPVFALTASLLRQAESACFAAGMEEVVGKPLRMEELNAKLVARFGRAEPTPIHPGGEAAGPPGGDAPVEVEVLLRHRAAVGQKAFSVVLELYRTNSQESVEALGNAIARGDLAEVAAQAHKLAGSSGLLGVRGIEQLARQMEQAALEGDAAAAVSLHRDLARQLPPVLEALELW